MKLRRLHEGVQHPACLQDLKLDLEAGEHRQAELARTYGVSRQRVHALAKRSQSGKRRKPPGERATQK